MGSFTPISLGGGYLYKLFGIILHSRFVCSFPIVYVFHYLLIVASQAALVVKNPPANAKDIRNMSVASLGWEDPLEEDMATNSSILAWRIP